MPALANPYLSYFRSLPLSCRRDASRSVDCSELRSAEWLWFKATVAGHFSWAIPTTAAIEAIGRHTDRVIDIGCGSGYWAWLMFQGEIEVIAFDTTTPPFAWREIVLRGNEVIVEHPDRTLFLCWPPWGTGMAFDTLSAYSGDLVVYVGEWLGGSAEARFFELLSSAFELVEAVDIPQWFMRTDRLTIHRRRRSQTHLDKSATHRLLLDAHRLSRFARRTV